MAQQTADKPEALGAADLCRLCDEKSLGFQDTNELEDLEGVIGQERAMGALDLALGMQDSGYNLFAIGSRGIGKQEIVERRLKAAAADRQTPSDWCYVNNFKEPHKPIAIALPAGQGEKFRDAMETLLEDMQSAMRAAFTSEEYRTRVQVLEEEYQERQQELFEEISEEAKKDDILLIRTPMGYTFVPAKNGKVISPDVFNALPDQIRKDFQEKIEALQEKLNEIMQKLPRWAKEMREKLRKINKETADFAVSSLIRDVREKFSDLGEVRDFLDDVHKDVLENFAAFAQEEGSDGAGGNFAQMMGRQPKSELMRRYDVNLIVNHAGTEGAAVIYEDEPTFQRLFGRIEYRAEMGTMTTDHNLIRAGALHRANGGYLIIDARSVLMQPMAWEALKRTLKSRQVRIEPLYVALGLASTTTLEPEPINIDVKIILIGERLIYYLLSQYDPDFTQLFKIPADFDERIERNKDNDYLFARLIATEARELELPTFRVDAVARLIDYAGRLVADSERLSVDIELLRDIMREAAYHMQKDNRRKVTAEDVQAARDARTRRSNRLNEQLQEQIVRGTILIDTDGEKVGQINGLSVYSLGDANFGKPTRITARTRLGSGKFVDIEREVALGGPIHSKGMLILSGYLGAHYVPDSPLSLHASLVFEQSYGGVEGDSASSAELYALLSSVAEIPIKQSFAVTGSVNQRGEVQAIGGVNEKIEGFFDLCEERGLTGDQGVLIPESNVKNLMLHRRVVDAVKARKFHIYPVKTIDEGIELLTGIKAGRRDKNGDFPDNTVNALVEDKLKSFAETRRQFGRTGKQDDYDGGRQEG